MRLILIFDFAFEIEIQLSDKYDSKCDECDDSQLCLVVRNEDGTNGYKCECPDNSDLGVDGACLAGTTKE